LATFGADTYGAAINTDVIAGGAGGTTNSLRFNTAAANTVTLTGTNTINSGGILVTPAVGANPSTISGGTLRGATAADLVVIQNNTAGSLTIGSTISDNGGATGLTKAGTGTLILSAANNYSGITTVAQGNLTYTGTLGSGPVNVVSGGTLQIGDGVDEWHHSKLWGQSRYSADQQRNRPDGLESVQCRLDFQLD
jgi:autotransporter-associated beta strand protein